MVRIILGWFCLSWCVVTVTAEEIQYRCLSTRSFTKALEEIYRNTSLVSHKQHIKEIALKYGVNEINLMLHAITGMNLDLMHSGLRMRWEHENFQFNRHNNKVIHSLAAQRIEQEMQGLPQIEPNIELYYGYTWDRMGDFIHELLHFSFFSKGFDRSRQEQFLNVCLKAYYADRDFIGRLLEMFVDSGRAPFDFLLKHYGNNELEYAKIKSQYMKNYRFLVDLSEFYALFAGIKLGFPDSRLLGETHIPSEIDRFFEDIRLIRQHHIWVREINQYFSKYFRYKMLESFS